MRSMPLKPLKRIEVREEGPGRYLMTIASALKDEAEFKRILREDVAECLGELDAFVNPDWTTKSFTLVTRDLAGFRQRLAYHRYLVGQPESQSPPAQPSASCPGPCGRPPSGSSTEP